MTARKPTPAKTTTAGGKSARAAIYALTAPGSDEIRYIGKANNPKDRLQGHIRDARTRKTPVYSWIRKLGAQGLAPEMRVLEWADDWVEAERRLIALHRPSGRLLNLADGGDEPKCTTEVRIANAKKLQAHPNTVTQRVINGPKSAKLRDPVLWAFKKTIGQMVAEAEKYKYKNLDRIKYAAARFKSLPYESQLAGAYRLKGKGLF